MTSKLKHFIVWALESLCNVIDTVIMALPKPIKNRIPWGCPLANLSADLDESWETGHWKSSVKIEGRDASTRS